MLRKAFQQLRNVEIDWDLQLHRVHVRRLTCGEPEISLCCCFCRGGRWFSLIRQTLPRVPSHVCGVDLCASSASPEPTLIKEEAELTRGTVPLRGM